MPFPNLTSSGPLYVSDVARPTQDGHPQAGQRVYFSYAIENNSVSAATAFDVQLWDDDANVLLYTKHFSGLAGRAQVRDADGYWDAPGSYCGSHNWLLVIDPGGFNGQVLEVNESPGDNQLPRQVQVDPPSTANLWIPTATASSGTVCAGDQIDIAVAVANRGTATSNGTVAVGLYVNPPGTPQPGTTPTVSMSTAAALAPLGSETLHFTRSRSTSGSETIYFLADWPNATSEPCGLEGDNAYGPMTLTWQPLGADLRMGGIIPAIPPNAEYALVGQRVTLHLAFSNVGAASTPAGVTVDLFKDRSTPPTPGMQPDVRLNMTKPLAAGRDTFVSFPTTSHVAGVWHMYAIVDGAELIDECGREANNVSGPYLLEWRDAAVTLQGTVAFREGNNYAGVDGGLKPLRNATCIVLDHDDNSDADTLVITATDDNGQFTAALENITDPDEPGSTVDPLIKVYLDADSMEVGAHAMVVQDTTRQTWSLTGPTHPNVQAGASIAYDTLYAGTYEQRSACHVYDVLLAAYRWARTQVDAAGVDVTWPCFAEWQEGSVGVRLDGAFQTAYDPASRRIKVVGRVNDNIQAGAFWPDEWDDPVLIHEYAHHVAWQVGAASRAGGPHSATGPALCGGVPCDSLAWDEGWAHFMAAEARGGSGAAVQKNVGIFAGPQRRFYELYLENGIVETDSTLQFPCVNDSGPAYELAVAGTLWDIADAVDDDVNGNGCGDALSDGPDRVTQAIFRHEHGPMRNISNVYRAYALSYCASDTALERRLYNVYCEHGMWSHGATGVPAGRDGKLGTIAVWPNPLRTGGATIALIGTYASSARAVAVFDVAGRLVRMVEGHNGPAEGKVFVWDGRDKVGAWAPAGIYFVRAEAGGGTHLARLVVLR